MHALGERRVREPAVLLQVAENGGDRWRPLADNCAERRSDGLQDAIICHGRGVHTCGMDDYADAAHTAVELLAEHVAEARTGFGPVNVRPEPGELRAERLGLAR